MYHKIASTAEGCICYECSNKVNCLFTTDSGIFSSKCSTTSMGFRKHTFMDWRIVLPIRVFSILLSNKFPKVEQFSRVKNVHRGGAWTIEGGRSPVYNLHWLPYSVAIQYTNNTFRYYLYLANLLFTHKTK